jgi:hypothetical protein
MLNEFPSIYHPSLLCQLTKSTYRFHSSLERTYGRLSLSLPKMFPKPRSQMAPMALVELLLLAVPKLPASLLLV